MKFRWKITLCMVCLMSVLFGIGGSALIAISFQGSIDRQEQTAKESCGLLLKTLRTEDNISFLMSEKDISNALNQLAAQGGFSAIRLSTDSGNLYTQGAAKLDFQNLSRQTDDTHLAVAYLKNSQGTPYLQVSSYFPLNGKMLQLDLGYNLSALYDNRAIQQSTYYKIFAVLLLLCAILAYSFAWLLTRPLSNLSKASREIASGNLSYRSGIHTGDEIGALSSDFDAMAQQVENSVRSLKDSARRQEQFMGNFAHEMKTPMTSIIGYADLLRGQSLSPEEQINAANYIFSEGKRLENLSLKLLDIFVADRQEIVMKSVSPAEIVRDLATYLKPVYEKDGIVLQCDCEEGVCLLELDLTRTLLLNLLENAKKALNGSGNIRITGTMLPDGYRFVVADNGSGIPPEALQHVTEAFYRVDKSRSRAQGSVGLGLSLCAKIVELHRGTLHFDSQPGAGTTVTVELKGGAV